MNERDIFIEALQQPDKLKRSAFLDEACGQDTMLRERVMELLNQEQGLSSFLDRPAFELPESTYSTTMQEGVGTVIGPYKLMEIVGEGGFGLVFIAEQCEPVRRRVALKLIKPGMDSSEVISRFEAERQALALMDHPNIARVLDAGTTDTGRPYFVMELVRGTPVNTFCDESQLSTRERLQLFLPICRAIQHSHQKGIIHRDIKPSNVLVTLQDGEPLPKVIDFGVAKALDQELTQRTVYTRFSQMIGTPLYMSPEQAEMSDLDVDTRSDIYSLGVLLYELLTGSTPVDRKQLANAAFDELRRIIREEEPPRPSTRLSQSGERLRVLAFQRKTEPARLSKMIRGDLDWIVMKALEKDRTRRYETANDFANDIQRYQRNEAVVACPPSTGYRLRKFARRNKTVFATIAAVTAALLLGTIVSTLQTISAIKAARTAKDQLYTSEMNQASDALARGEISRMNELLDKHRPVSPESDQRDFEWYLLWGAGHSLKGWARNTNVWPFQDLAVSPDGKTLAVIDFKAPSIHLYDSNSMRLICNPLQIGSPLDKLYFSPNGRFLIASDYQKSPLRIFDTEHWGHIRTLNSGPSSAVAFASEKPLMATAGWGQITLWNTTSWKRSESWPAQGAISHLAMTPDGTKLASVVKTASIHRVELWDVTEQEIVQILPDFDLKQDELEFSPDGSLLAIGDEEGEVRLWNTTELFAKGVQPSPMLTLSASNPIESLAFSPDATRLAVSTRSDHAVLVWDINSLESLSGQGRLNSRGQPTVGELVSRKSSDDRPVATLRGHTKNVTDVSFVGDANTICSSGRDGYLKMWDLFEYRPYDVITGVGREEYNDVVGSVQSQAGHASDGTLIYRDEEWTIQRYDVTTRKSRSILDTEQKYSRIALSDDGSVLAAVTHDEEQLQIWNLADESKVATSSLSDVKRHIASYGGVSADKNIPRLIVSNDGRRVACLVTLRADQHGPVILIDSTTGKWFESPELSYTAVWPAFSPCGQHIVTHNYLNISTLWNIKPGSLQLRFPIQGQGPDLCAAYSPDGDTLAIGSWNHEIRLYRAASGELIGEPLKGHTERVMSVAFTGDGRHLVSAAWDGTVRIWKMVSGEYTLVSTLHTEASKDNAISLVSVAPNGDSIATLHRYGGIRVWRRATPQEVSTNFDEQLARASNYYSEGKSDDALRELGDVLTLAPTEPRARALRGRVHDRRGEWKSAADDWTIALQSAPENLHFLQSRAKAYALGQEWHKAAADWNKLVQLTNGANGEYLLGRGECYLHAGRRNAALADFKKALTRTASLDSIERIISLLGFAESVVPTEAQWRYATGRQPLHNWKTKFFDDSEWLTGRAPFGAGQLGLPTRSDWRKDDIWLRHTFQRAHESDAPLILHMRADDDVTVFINGVQAATTGSTVNENVEYKRVYQVLQCAKEARLRKGENVLAVHCRNRDLKSYLDIGLYVQDDQVDMESMLIAATELATNNAVLETALAVRFVEQRRWEEAAIHFHKSAKLSPGQEGVWMWAALMYYHSGDLEGYHQLSGEIIERFRKANSVLRTSRLARACLLAEPSAANFPGLIEMADRALEFDPQSPSARVAKALAEFRDGQVETAMEWAENCGEDHLQALCVLALARARAGKPNLAAGDELAKFIDGRDESLFQVSFSRNHESHEVAFLETLLNEVKRNLSAP